MNSYDCNLLGGRQQASPAWRWVLCILGCHTARRDPCGVEDRGLEAEFKCHFPGGGPACFLHEAAYLRRCVGLSFLQPQRAQ